MAPAGELVVDGDTSSVPLLAEQFQLTDAVLANLTELELSDISHFQFPDAAIDNQPDFSDCKTFPGDRLWPSSLVWKVFDLLTGGALIKTIPIGAVCYENHEHYDVAKCDELLEHWTETGTQ